MPAELMSYEKIPTLIYKTAHEASVAVAKEIAELNMTKHKKGEYAVFGLATGSTPKRVYTKLIRMHREEGLSF